MLSIPHDDIYDRRGASTCRAAMAFPAWLVSRMRIPLPAMSSQLLDQQLGSPASLSRGRSTARPDEKRSRRQDHASLFRAGPLSHPTLSPHRRARQCPPRAAPPSGFRRRLPPGLRHPADRERSTLCCPSNSTAGNLSLIDLRRSSNCGASHPRPLPNDFDLKPQVFKISDNAVSLMRASFTPPRAFITSYRPGV